jgi:hypothetical protein
MEAFRFCMRTRARIFSGKGRRARVRLILALVSKICFNSSASIAHTSRKGKKTGGFQIIQDFESFAHRHFASSAAIAESCDSENDNH